MAKLKPLTVLPLLVAAGLIVLAGIAMRSGSVGNRELPSALVGRSAPDLPTQELGDLPGIPADALIRDGVKLVNFWASWCGPCRVEHPSITALADAGLPVFGVNYKDDPAKALAFLQELGNPYTAINADASGRSALEWGVYGVPETYLIGADGEILLRLAGPVTQRAIDERLRPALQKAGISFP